ncbi:DEAD/DEAH box helicase [Candidatus Woesearchaeota archaeon]|nr:MAG: DEAD/DEAH box helicase [Candidatus Woesearchaeota archaeon]
MKFEDLKLKDEIVRALERLGFQSPTEVQEKAIPKLLAGRDLIVRSKTGSGKTFAFLLPILNTLSEKRELQAVVLAPTRELAQQIEREIHKINRKVKTVLLYGGVSIGPQMERLDAGAQIAVATPGRILDHMERGTIDFSKVKYAVLDEADRMLDMGFIDDVGKILQAMPEERQTTLFSATMPEQIKSLASRYMKDPETLMLQQDEVCVNNIKQRIIGMDRKQKLPELFKILKDSKAKKVMVFANTKSWTERLGNILYKRRFKATSIHSGLSQNKRNRVIRDFNSGRYNILVATDVAARGLHIEGVTHVVNYDIPRNPKDYVHRIGRTGRAGRSGDAITFVTQIDQHLLRSVESEINTRFEVETIGEQNFQADTQVQIQPRAQSYSEAGACGDDWGLD